MEVKNSMILPWINVNNLAPRFSRSIARGCPMNCTGHRCRLFLAETSIYALDLIFQLRPAYRIASVNDLPKTSICGGYIIE